VSRARPLTGRKVLIWLLGFFGIVIGANAWFVTLSVRNFHGEDRQRPYQQGLDYNRTLALRQQQQALGWQAALGIDNKASPARLRLFVHRPDGSPVQGLTLSGTLRHPADTFHDVTVKLAAVGPGVYEGAIVDAGHGRRTALIRAEGPIPFETEGRVWLP